jgi:hypothetical protein
MMVELRTRRPSAGPPMPMSDPQSSWPEIADFRKIQEEITQSITLAVQFYIRTNVYSIIAWLFLMVATNYFLVFPNTSGGAVGSGTKHQVMEYAIAVTMVIIGLTLNLSAWSDLREKGSRLEALRIATYDLVRERGTRDIVEREWRILGDMTFSGRKEGQFLHSVQFICFLVIHLGLAAILIFI